MRRLAMAALAVALLGASSPAAAEVTVVFDHNTGAAASGSFTFKNVPAPAKSDAASGARVVLVQNRAAPDCGGADVLVDDRLPRLEDEPAANFYFSKALASGCFRIDLGRAVDIARVNTYSWHPNRRGPQVYKLFASASDSASPPLKGDPVSAGWRLVASVDTRAHQKVHGGQYGASVSDSSGSIGVYRHLLFCAEPSMPDDPAWHTFYSEVDVIEKKK